MLFKSEPLLINFLRPLKEPELGFAERAPFENDDSIARRCYVVLLVNNVFDVVVIGAGFGGLGAALTLSELGARVALNETLRYPGGCASTFEKFGHRFESGATLMAGLAPHQLFGAWLNKYQHSVQTSPPNRLIELRTPHFNLSVSSRREHLIEQLVCLPNAPAAKLRRFFEEQQTVANTLWQLLDDRDRLPPLGAASLFKHLQTLPKYTRILKYIGKSLGQVIEEYGLGSFQPLRIYLDALCQITVQCNAQNAEAPFALAAIDYPYRGAAHVHGGVGRIAEGLLKANAVVGTQVLLANRVSRVEREPSGLFLVHTRRGIQKCRAIVANVLPEVLGSMLGSGLVLNRKAQAIQEKLNQSWSAAMLYAVLEDDDSVAQLAHHLELVRDVEKPFTEGNHLFASISEPVDSLTSQTATRSLTVSTHVPLSPLSDDGGDAQYFSKVHERMKENLAHLAPEVSQTVKRIFTASPRTFARFTGRPFGAVGGIPRKVGLSNYLTLTPVQAAQNIWLVGDSVGLGQSALAAATFGQRTAHAVVKAI